MDYRDSTVFTLDANGLFTTNLKEVPVFALECAWMGTLVWVKSLSLLEPLKLIAAILSV